MDSTPPFFPRAYCDLILARATPEDRIVINNDVEAVTGRCREEMFPSRNRPTKSAKGRPR